MPPAVALRPRSFSELFDAAFLLAREQFRPLATLSAMVAIPAIAIGVVNVWLFGPAGLPTAQPSAASSAALHALPLTVVATCWYFVGVGALVHAAAGAYLGEAIDPAASLRRAGARAGALIGAHLLAYLIAVGVLLVAVLAVAVGGVVLGVALKAVGVRGVAGNVAAGAIGAVGATAAIAVAAAVLARYVNMTAVLVLEGPGAVAALRRSRALGAGHARRIVGLFAILIVLSIAMSLTALGLGALAGNVYVSNLVASLLSVPLYPLLACVLTALYFDLRIRKEGFDIAYAARELGDAGQSAPAA